MQVVVFFFFFKQKTAYEMRISDWSSDVCSSDLFAEVSEIQDRVHALREGARNLRRGAGMKLRISALPSLALGVLPEAVAHFLTNHPHVNFDLQTVHHDDLVRKLHERETDIAIAVEVPQNAPIGSRWLGEGELVVLYREADKIGRAHV